MEKLAENLKRIRQERGMTQAQVAKRIPVDRTTYTKYENGIAEPHLGNLVKLCDVLQVSPNELLGWESEKR